MSDKNISYGTREEAIIHNCAEYLDIDPQRLEDKEFMARAISIWNDLPELMQLNILHRTRRQRVMLALDSLDSYDVHVLTGQAPEECEYLSTGCEFELMTYMQAQCEEWDKNGIESDKTIHGYETEDNIVNVDFNSDKGRILH